MATLQLRIDPTQMESGSARAERSLKGLKVEARRVESAVDRMASRGARSTDRLGGAVRGMGARMQGARGQIQNTAFQVGDFATQVGAGTSASIALGQQLPQLLGGFGALGAVLGAVVAVGVPLAASFVNIADSAGEAAERLKEVRETAAALTSEIRALSLGISEDELTLADNVTQKRRELLRVENEIANSRAGQQGLLNNKIGPAQEALAAAQEELKTFREQVAEQERLSTIVAETANQERLLGQQMQFTAEHAAEAEAMAGLLRDGISAATIDGMRLAGLDLASGIDAGAAAAARLADALGIAYNRAVAIQGMSVVEAMGQNMPGGNGGPQGPAGLLPQDPSTPFPSGGQVVNAGMFTGSPGSRGGSGGSTGGVSQINQVSEAYKRLIATLDPLARASLDLAQAQDTISAAQAAGIITAEEAARAYGMAQEEYDEMIGRAEESTRGLDDAAGAAQDAFDRLFDSIIEGGADAGDILRDLGNQLIKFGFKDLLGGAFPSLFGDGGFLSFDGGGYTGSGARMGGVDGKGGFPAILHPNETVIDHTRGGGQVGGRIEVVARVENGSIVQDVRQISGDVAVQVMTEGISRYDRQTLPGSVERIQRDPKRRG
ncbi:MULTISPECIES: hypothetical protein [unclassified Roseovarius]|uniref:hypothetical protein n=1 Tax=unclassified Roseovarius TaxID=2614913 RepID=UPI00273F1EAE|nr:MULTISPECIES: hypothetical protein [unclassified Roseovarius]